MTFILERRYLGSETLEFVAKGLKIGFGGGTLSKKTLELTIKVLWNAFTSSFRKEVICCNMDRHNLTFESSYKACIVVDRHEWRQHLQVIQFSHLQMLCNRHPTTQYMSQMGACRFGHPQCFIQWQQQLSQWFKGTPKLRVLKNVD